MPAAKEEKKAVDPQAPEAEVSSPENHPLEEEVVYQEPTKEEINRLLRQHVWGAIGVGLIPFPLVDLVGLVGVQINLLRKLAHQYNVPFFKDTARNVISSLVASGIPVAAAPELAASVAKMIPFFGQTVGVVTMPILAGASTYAVGKVFIQHFASGGTFLTFDPEKVRAYYAEMFEEGKQVASDIKKARDAKK